MTKTTSGIKKALVTALFMLTAIGGTSVGFTTASAESLFSRDRNVSVLQRERPEYAPLGLRRGAFIIRPRVDLTVAYSDNVFAVGEDTIIALRQAGEDDATFAQRNADLISQLNNQDDLYFVLRPSLNFESDWNNHAVSGGTYVEVYRHIDFDTEDVVNVGVFVDGRYDVRRQTAITGGFSYDLLHEGRKTTNSVVVPTEPIEYILGQAYIGADREFGRIKARGRLTARDYDFDEAQIVTGTLGQVDQSFRNRREYSVLLQADYAITRDASVFIRGTLNERDYDNASLLLAPVLDPNRNSSGYGISAGVDFDITRLARGSIGVGYIQQEYDSASFADIDGLGVDATVEYFPTELTTVTFNAARGIRDSALIDAAGITATNFSVRVDQELARNLILTGSLAYGEDEFENLARTDTRYGGTLGAIYYLNRIFSASVTYAYENQESDGDPTNAFVREYETNELFLTLTAQR